MISPTFLAENIAEQRWALSAEPISDPVEETCSANSTNNPLDHRVTVLKRTWTGDLLDLLVVKLAKS